MSKVTAPLLSFGAGGQVGTSMVFSKWRGVPYVRRYVVPSNPNTLAQQAIRKRFALLREIWKLAPSTLVEPWDAFATGRPFTGMNKFVGENIRVLKAAEDFANFIGSPGARGGLPPADVEATTGSGEGEVDVAVTTPAPPPGWELVGAQGVAFPDGDPAGIFLGPLQAKEEAGVDPSFTFDGFEGGIDVVTSVWLKWTKPDGYFAYSVSITDITASGA